MFYRKQNYLLILICICSLLFFFFPFARFEYHGLPCSVSVLGFSGFSLSVWTFWILRVLASALIGFSLVALTQFQKRPLQLRLVMFAFFANILLVGFCFITIEVISNKIKFENDVDYTILAYIPILVLLLLTIVQRSIRRDEAIAKSLDRLR